jgi:hypothetical protein
MKINRKNQFWVDYRDRTFNFESAILSNESIVELINLCKFPLYQQWKLIYRATRDGFGASDFHSKCAKYQNSLVIIKSTSGNVFGGYTQQSWSGKFEYKADQNAFLFSFINELNKKVIIKCTDPFSAINATSKFGPTFGRGHDLHICSNSNIRNSSYSDLRHSYKHSIYVFDEEKYFLVGSENFMSTDIEVFTKE